MRYVMLIVMLLCLPVRGEAWQVVGGEQSAGLSVAENFDDYTNLASIGTLHGWVHPNDPDAGYADARSVSDRVVGTVSRTSLAYWGADTFAANQEACMTVKAVGPGGPAVRINSASGSKITGYSARSSGGNHALFKGDSLLAVYSAQNVNDVVCISVTGTATTTITVTINGTPQASYADSTSPYDFGQPGLFTVGNVYYGDDWTAAEL